jgi:hypothetical protein
MASHEVVRPNTENSLVLPNFSNALRPSYPAGRTGQRETVTIRDARIIYRNFTGKKGPYNEEGERSFSILLDAGLGGELSERGLNVKPIRQRDEDEEPMFHLPVAVSYKIRPPRVYTVTGDGVRLPLRKQIMPEDVVHMMDLLDLGDCHMVLSISNYDVRGTKGKKCYLQSFFGHVLMDELEQEYSTVEDMVKADSEEHEEEDNIIEGEWSEA